MAINKSGTEVFLQMWAACKAVIPQGLIRQDPRLLIRFLELSGRPEGIFQMELRRRLGINQPRLSKLTQKLVEAGWIEVHTPDGDGRKRLTITTGAGKEWLTALSAKLEALVVAPPVPPRPKVSRKGIRPVSGQPTFDLDQFF
jgi:hypothetical protein